MAKNLKQILLKDAFHRSYQIYQYLSCYWSGQRREVRLVGNTSKAIELFSERPLKCLIDPILQNLRPFGEKWNQHIN